MNTNPSIPALKPAAPKASAATPTKLDIVEGMGIPRGKLARVHEAMAAYRESRGQSEGAAVYALLKPDLIAYARRVAGSESEDLAQDAILDVLQRIDECRALAPGATQTSGAYLFAVLLLKSRVSNWLLKRRNTSRALAEYSEEAQIGYAVAEHQDPRLQIFADARAAVLEMMATGVPADLRALATEAGVGSDPAVLEGQIKAFELLRVEGDGAVEVGRELGLEGRDDRITAVVWKRAQRGCAALRLGALVLARTEADAERREWLVKMAQHLGLKQGRSTR